MKIILVIIIVALFILLDTQIENADNEKDLKFKVLYIFFAFCDILLLVIYTAILIRGYFII